MISQGAPGGNRDLISSQEGLEVKVGLSVKFELLHLIQLSCGRQKLT